MNQVQNIQRVHPLIKPLSITDSSNDLSFFYISDIVFQSKVLKIPIINVEEKDGTYTYSLDLSFMVQEISEQLKAFKQLSAFYKHKSIKYHA
ncbi:hypothetical protein pb186bvf_007048 [Paramecium bursaria]